MADEHPVYRVGLAAGDAVGSRVAGYRLERQVGAGGMAVVFERAMTSGSTGGWR